MGSDFHVVKGNRLLLISPLKIFFSETMLGSQLLIAVWYFFAAFVTVAWVAVGWNMPFVSLSENQALYVFSSQAQVVAAVYGLTITGYIFLHNQQDRLADKDETVADALEDIKLYQHYFMTFLTVVSLVSIFFALLAIVFRESPSAALKVVTQNSAAALFVVALMCTGYFVRDAMRPNKIEEASDRIKKRMEDKTIAEGERGAGPGILEAGEVADASQQMELSPVELDEPDETIRNMQSDIFPSGAAKTGAFEQFLASYNRIEQSLEMFAHIYLDRARTSSVSYSSQAEYQNSGGRRSSWTKPRVVHAMLAQGLISSSLAENLLELTKYRNALVHGRDFSVSSEMLDRVQKASEALDHVMHKQSSY